MRRPDRCVSSACSAGILLAATAAMVDLRRARVHLIDRIQDKLAQVIWLTAARHYSKRERVRKIPRDVAFVCLRSNADDARIAHMDLREKEQGRM